MSWGRSRSERDPPRAFSGYNEPTIRNAIKKMAQEQLHMAIRNVTSDDLRNLFIPVEHREAVKRAFGYARENRVNQAIELQVPDQPSQTQATALNNNRLEINLSWDYNKCKEGFFVPSTAKPTVQPDAPPELVEKLENLYREASRIAYEFGLVAHVFSALNANGYCNTPAQMRYVWPAIRHIVDKAGMTALGKTLIDASARAGDKARVPPAVADLMVPTVHIVARTLVIGEVDMQEKRDFNIRMGTAYFQTPDGNVTFKGQDC